MENEKRLIDAYALGNGIALYMEKKILTTTSYYLQFRHDGATREDAANYFADSYEEYLVLLNHLKKF